MTNKKISNHIVWVDVAKGIGIFLIFYGHMLYKASNPTIGQLIYSFHVAFFFILSGFVFSKKEANFLGFLKNKIFRLIIPTFIFVTIGLLVAIFAEGIRDPILLVRYFFYYDGTYYWNMPCWFFTTLFFVYLIVYFIPLHKMRMYWKIFLVAIVFVSGYLIYSQMPYIENEVNPFLKFGIDKTIIVLGFFLLGNLFKDFNNIIHFERNKIYLKPLLVVSTIVWLIFGLILNPHVSIYNRQVGNYWFFILSSISGSIIFMILAIYISKIVFLVPVFIALANNSILIACTHYLDRCTATLLLIIGQSLNIYGTYKMDVFIPFYVIAFLAIYVVVGYFINKYLPFISGAKIRNKIKAPTK